MAERFLATVLPLGRNFEAPRDETLLASALQAGVEILSSCQNGTCRTCIARLAVGQVDYRIAWPGLSREEKQEGWILPCVAYPRSDVVIEAPFARTITWE